MKHRIVKIFVAVWMLSFLVCSTTSANDLASSESGYYAFESGELVAAYKSGFLPVLSGGKKGVYIDTERGLKRIRYSAKCRFIPRVGVSNQVVNILDVEFGFDNLRQAQLESGAVTDMMMAEAGTEMAIIMKGGGIATAPAGGLSEEAQAEITDMKDRQEIDSERMRRSFEDDAYHRGELSDLINVKFKLTSEAELTNVYCAMVVRYLQKNIDDSSKVMKVKIVRMKKVGDLRVGIPKTMKFTYPLTEGFVNKSGIDIFLFSGEGRPLATNLSRGIRPLTIEEMEKIQALN